MSCVAGRAPHISYQWDKLLAVCDHLITVSNTDRKSVWSKLYEEHGGKQKCCSLLSPKHVNVLDIYPIDASQVPAKEHTGSLSSLNCRAHICHLSRSKSPSLSNIYSFVIFLSGEMLQDPHLGSLRDLLSGKRRPECFTLKYPAQRLHLLMSSPRQGDFLQWAFFVHLKDFRREK